jgi:hypothetical protein
MPAHKPPLTEELILLWADAHRGRTGCWPHARSGRVEGAPGQSWGAVNRALARGGRGLPGGSSLARLLGARRGRRNQAEAPPLTAGQILLWADAHFRRTGHWPAAGSGPVAGAAGESWAAVASALWAGHRGLPGGETLAQLLRRHGRGDPGRARGGLSVRLGPPAFSAFRNSASQPAEGPSGADTATPSRGAPSGSA